MLHELIEYAKQEQLSAEPGFKPKTVRWLLVFSSQGDFLGVQDLKGEERRSRGREFKSCPDLTQQEMVGVGKGCRHFLVDGLDVVSLLTKDGEVGEKLVAKHAFFLDLLSQASSTIAALGPVAAALDDEDTLTQIRSGLAEAKAKPTDQATIAVSGSEPGMVSIIVEGSQWHDWWRTHRVQMIDKRKSRGSPKSKATKAKAQGAETESLMRCLLSGELVEPQPTHNKIGGLSAVGGLAMGDALTSFDKEAFGSFGLQQGANAAMSEAMVKTYTTALNDLLKRRSYPLPGVKVLYWYSAPIPEDEDVFAEVLQGFSEPAPNASQDEGDAAANVRERALHESRARRLLEAFRSGGRLDLVKARYYALTLSANSGRVVVRDWMEGSFKQLAEAVNSWFTDLAIVTRNGRDILRSQKFASVLAAPLRDLKDAASPLVTSMWRCAIKSQPIPYQVMAQTLARVRIDLIKDEPARHARLALLKAYCNRKEGVPDMSPELNEYETDPGYLCGRILAVLAGIQQKAMPNVGVGVVQRYYAAASATPGLMLGRLVRTAQIAHLPKIQSEGLRRWFENQLADVWQKLQCSPPRVLTLEQQTLFAMGYYHQFAQRSQKSEQVMPDSEQG